MAQQWINSPFFSHKIVCLLKQKKKDYAEME